jgi:mannose-6-phosphate isomerase-like protein (cupin superfamily)
MPTHWCAAARPSRREAVEATSPNTRAVVGEWKAVCASVQKCPLSLTEPDPAYDHEMGYTKTNLREVENQAPKFGMPEELEARFARTALGGKTLGLSLMKLAPSFRIPFGHKHAKQEEVYVVVHGSARIKVEQEIVELGEWDAIRLDKNTMRAVEAGPDGVEYLAFGAGDDPADAEMVQDWWND